MEADFRKYILNFKLPSGTSRGVLTQKETWFIIISDGAKKGIGECGLLRGLSADDRPDYEQMLRWTCSNINRGLPFFLEHLTEFPSIQFGLETAFLSLKGDPFILFPSDFTDGNRTIEINGLVWMSDKAEMKRQIEEKISSGFSCIKLKIGAIDFADELNLLKFIRRDFDARTIEIRLDANGAFEASDASNKINQLSEYQIHSIEQPIKPKQLSEMKMLCRETPVPIALDEELIGVFDTAEKLNLLGEIRPQYIILKPSLIGGFAGSDEWIAIAENLGIKWWMTSALESNIGLNAIAQWTVLKNNPMPQGLGTGGLYTNNFDSPLYVGNGRLGYDPAKPWNVRLPGF